MTEKPKHHDREGTIRKQSTSSMNKNGPLTRNARIGRKKLLVQPSVDWPVGHYYLLSAFYCFLSAFTQKTTSHEDKLSQLRVCVKNHVFYAVPIGLEVGFFGVFKSNSNQFNMLINSFITDRYRYH